MEGTFLWFEVQVMLLCDMQNISNGCDVVFQRRTCGDGNVIHIYTNDGPSGCVFGDDLLVNLVHHCLKCGRGVTKAEEHDRGFEEAMACFEGRFVFVAFLDTHIVISPAYIQLGEYGCSPKIGEEVRDEGKI